MLTSKQIKKVRRMLSQTDPAAAASQLQREVAAGQQREHQLAQLLDECRTALRIVAVGIWRNKRKNTCGLAGAAVAVHAVEAALAKCDDYIEDRPVPQGITVPTLTQQEFRSLKTKLTRAINSKDPQRVLKTTTEALAIFDEKGHPDSWIRWQRAKEDAEWQIRRTSR